MWSEKTLKLNGKSACGCCFELKITIPFAEWVVAIIRRQLYILLIQTNKPISQFECYLRCTLWLGMMTQNMNALEFSANICVILKKYSWTNLAVNLSASDTFFWSFCFKSVRSLVASFFMSQRQIKNIFFAIYRVFLRVNCERLGVDYAQIIGVCSWAPDSIEFTPESSALSSIPDPFLDTFPIASFTGNGFFSFSYHKK